MATEASQMFSEFVKDKIGEEDYAKKQYTYLSLQHLHGRACQEYLEILALMRGGFADGAFARWRSLYELACVASFIEMHGEAVAEQFFEQADSERRAYKWAESVLDPSGRPVKSFAQVQTMCKVAEEWSEYYSDACLVTHASPQGTFGRIANGTAANIIPVGRSDYGLQVPGRLSATILQWITGLFLTTFPHIDSIANVRAITEMAEDIQKMYYDTHQEVFKDLIEEEQTDGQEGPRFEGT
jgi:hypothetical protein